MEIVSRAGPALARGGGRVPAGAPRRSSVYLGVCDGNMEEGSLRCDANISLRPRGADRARHEDRDQEPELVPGRPARARVRDRAPGAGARRGRAARAGDAPAGTPTRGSTVSMRTKEYAHDYRYFPEPDLLPAAASSRGLGRRDPSAALPELPRGAPRSASSRRTACPPTTPSCSRSDRALADYFEEAVRAPTAKPEDRRQLDHERAPARAAGRRRAAVARLARSAPRHLAGLLALIDDGTHQRQDRQGRLREDVSRRARTRRHDRAPRGPHARSPTRARSAGWSTRCSPPIPRSSPTTAGGQEGRRAGFLVGQVMKATGGKANPQPSSTACSPSASAPAEPGRRGPRAGRGPSGQAEKSRRALGPRFL